MQRRGALVQIGPHLFLRLGVPFLGTLRRRRLQSAQPADGFDQLPRGSARSNPSEHVQDDQPSERRAAPNAGLGPGNRPAHQPRQHGHSRDKSGDHQRKQPPRRSETEEQHRRRQPQAKRGRAGCHDLLLERFRRLLDFGRRALFLVAGGGQLLLPGRITPHGGGGPAFGPRNPRRFHFHFLAQIVEPFRAGLQAGLLLAIELEQFALDLSNLPAFVRLDDG